MNVLHDVCLKELDSLSGSEYNLSKNQHAVVAHMRRALTDDNHVCGKTIVSVFTRDSDEIERIYRWLDGHSMSVARSAEPMDGFTELSFVVSCSY